MRSVLAISMPPVAKKAVEKRAKKAEKSVSAYVLDALNLVEQLISEDELLAMAKKAERRHKAEKTKELKSFTDLLA